MKRFFKIIISLVTLVFTLILVATLYLLNADPNNHKDYIAARIASRSGLEVSFDGKIGLTLYPWLGITLQDFVVANPPGFSDIPMLQAQNIIVRAKFMPLLNREYEVDTILIHGARVHLETNELGQGNWQLLTNQDQLQGVPPGAAGTQPEQTAINRLLIGGVDIQDASVTFDDRFNDLLYQLDDITASTGELVYGEPVDVFMGFNGAVSEPSLSTQISLTGTALYDLDNQLYELQPLNITGTLSGASVPGGSTELGLSTKVVLDLDEDLLTMRDFTLTTLDAQFNANINGLRIISNDPVYQVNMAAAGNDLSLFFQVLENDALVAQIRSLASQSFSVSGLVESAPLYGDLSISNLRADLLDASIEGSISAQALQTETPVINGSINASGPDLPTLLEVAGQFQGRDSELSRYGRELQQSPDHSFRVNTSFNADLESGVVEIPAMEIQVLGAILSGTVSAGNINEDSPFFNGRLNASGPDFPLLMQIAGQLTDGRDSLLNRYGRQLRGVNNKAFEIAAPFNVNLENGFIDLRDIDASFLGLAITGNIQGSNFQNASGNLEGRLSVTGRNIRELLTAIDQPDVIETLSLDVGLSGSRNALSVSLFSLDAGLGGSQGNLALRADSIVDLDNESVSARNISLRGLGLDLEASLFMTDYSESRNFFGQVAASPFNLRQFMTLLEQDLPVTTDPTVLQAVGITTEISGTADSVQLTNMDLILDDTAVTGELGLSDLYTDSFPAVDFDLAVSTINLDRYSAPEVEPLELEDTSNTEIPAKTFRTLDLDGELKVGRMTYSNLDLANVVMHVHAEDGDLAITPMTADFYEGRFDGEIHLNTTGESPLATVDSSLTGINLEPLLFDFMDASYVSGYGDLLLSLTGRGMDTSTIKRNLNGAGSLALHDGIIQGVDVGSVLAQVETMIREQRPGSVVRGEQTPFDNFSATIDVNSGIVSSSDLLIQSNGFDVTGSGMLANLTDHSIAFNLVANVDESPATDERTYDIGGYSLPIACTGMLESPRCLPDIQSILAGAIRSAIQRGLTDLLQRAIGDETEDSGSDATQQEEEVDPGRVLLNRALESLFNN